MQFSFNSSTNKTIRFSRSKCQTAKIDHLLVYVRTLLIVGPRIFGPKSEKNLVPLLTNTKKKREKEVPFLFSADLRRVRSNQTAHGSNSNEKTIVPATSYSIYTNELVWNS